MILLPNILLLLFCATLTTVDSERCTVPKPVVCHFMSFKCPLNEDGNPEDGAFPDPDDPQRYYNCANGVAFAHICPQGSVFVNEFFTSNCTYRVCIDTQKETEVTQPEQNGVKVADPKTITHQKVFKKKYTDAVSNSLIPTKNIHGDENNSSCAGLSNLSGCQSSDVFTCRQDELGRPIDGTYAHPTVCSMYYHCKNNIAYPQICPPNYAFSPTPRVRSCGYLICLPEDRGICPVDGAWSEWSTWSNCSVSCGGGQRSRTRECNNPPPSNWGRECPGSDLEFEECNTSDCEIDNGDLVIFYASYNSTGYYQYGLDPVPFDIVHINQGSAFDPGRSIFTIPRNGIYHVGLNAGSLRDRDVEFTLMRDNNESVNILRRNYYHRGTGIMARDYIGYFEKGEELRIVSGNDTGLDGATFPEAYLTSWVIFEYGNNDNTTAFFAAYTYTISFVGKLIYDTIPLNVGGSYSSGYFTPFQAGIYFISWGAGMDRSKVDIHLECNGTCTGFYDSKGIWCENSNSGIDIKSRSTMQKLFTESSIYTRDLTSYRKYSDSQMQTYFSGFYYSSAEDNNTVAFSVWLKSGIVGPEDVNPLYFDVIVLNHGDGYVNGYFTCRLSGYYYVHMTSGGSATSPVKMWLLKNNVEKVAGIIVNGVWGRSVRDVYSRSLIIYLSSGETLNVMVEAFSNIANADTNIGLTGFLL